jgi:hypothetical protein
MVQERGGPSSFCHAPSLDAAGLRLPHVSNLITSERRDEREDITAGSYGLGIQVCFHVHSCKAVEKIDFTALVVV